MIRRHGLHRGYAQDRYRDQCYKAGDRPGDADIKHRPPRRHRRSYSDECPERARRPDHRRRRDKVRQRRVDPVDAACNVMAHFVRDQYEQQRQRKAQAVLQIRRIRENFSLQRRPTRLRNGQAESRINLQDFRPRLRIGVGQRSIRPNGYSVPAIVAVQKVASKRTGVLQPSPAEGRRSGSEKLSSNIVSVLPL